MVYDANLKAEGLTLAVGTLHAYFGVFDGHNGEGHRSTPGLRSTIGSLTARSSLGLRIART